MRYGRYYSSVGSSSALSILFGFAAALGGGLLIGIERERRNGFGAGRALAGVRTFALASITGPAASALAQPLLTFAGAVLALAAIGRWRRQPLDPGVTTELALFVTYLLACWQLIGPLRLRAARSLSHHSSSRVGRCTSSL